LLDVVRASREQNKLEIRSPFTSVAFSADGKSIVSSSSTWDAITGKPGKALVRKNKNLDVSDIWDRPEFSKVFSPDGKLIASSNGADLQIYEASTGEPIGEPLQGHDRGNIYPVRCEGIESVSFSPDNNHIVSSGCDYTVRIWDAKRVFLGKTLPGNEEGIHAVSFSPDGNRIASGGWDKTVQIWDAKMGALIGKPLKGHTDSVGSVAFSRDGERIASGSHDNTVRIWDAKTGAPIGKPLKGHTDSVNSVAFSRDGERIASGSNDNTVRIWDAKTGAPIGKPLKGHTDSVNSVAFSPNSERVISGSVDMTVRIWDVSKGKLIGKPLQRSDNDVSNHVTQEFSIGGPTNKMLKINGSKLWAVAFSPDGTRIVSGSLGNTLRIWDAKTGTLIGKPLQSENGKSIISLAFSQDGQRIVSGGWDGTVRIWDARTGAPIGKPLKAGGLVGSVGFSPDGKHIVSGSYNVGGLRKKYTSSPSDDKSMMKIWSVSWDSLLPIACDRLRYHPSLNANTDFAREAKQTCEQYVLKK
jgi:WD40 repeat protein